MIKIAQVHFRQLWRENRISPWMGIPVVFVASSRDTSLETAGPPMSSTEQDQLDKRQVITDSQPSSVSFYQIDDFLYAGKARL